MPTIEDALIYIGIDYPDEVVTRNVTRAMNTARRTLLGAVGEDLDDFLPGDPRATELILIYTDDLYSEKGVSAKVSGATRRLARDMELQLQMELARAREATTAEVVN